MTRVLPLVLLAACAQADLPMNFVAWGEDAAAEGIPASAFVDGWEVTFSEVAIGFGHIHLTNPNNGNEFAESDEEQVVELAGEASPVAMRAINTVSGRQDLTFELSEIEAGETHHFVGEGTLGDQTVGFNLHFDVPVVYDLCTNGADGSQGIVGEENGTVELTAHLEHLFFNSLGTEEAQLAFQAIADADANMDGTVTNDELAAVSVDDIGYETSGADVANLDEFIAYALIPAIHLNGGGVCRATVGGESHEHDHAGHDH